MLWAVEKYRSGGILKVQAEEKQMVGAGLREPKCWAPTCPSGLHMDRSAVWSVAVDALGGPLFHQANAEKLNGKGLTNVSNQVAI